MKTPLITMSLFSILLATLLVSLTSHSTERPEFPVQANQYSKTEKEMVAMLFESVDKRVFDQKLFSRGLSSQHLAIQKIAIKGLARIGGEAIFPLVEGLISKEDKTIRRLAVLALGQSKTSQANALLWQLLSNEKSTVVRSEIYLALAHLTEENIVSKFLNQTESSNEVKKSIYHSLAATLTYNRDIKQNYELVDFKNLLNQVAKDDEMSAPIAYFLARVPGIDKQILPSQITRLITGVKSLKNKRLVARLIGKSVKESHYANRKILSWLIEQSESKDVRLATEAIRAMVAFVHIPQAKIQLGKLHASSNLLIAQTALQVLADSSLSGKEILSLFKKQLKSENAGMVVAAMSGLINRQERDDMTWAIKILQHQDTYVKTNFAKLIFYKDGKGFNNVLRALEKDRNPIVSAQATKLLKRVTEAESSNEQPPELNNLPTASYEAALASSAKVVTLKTTIGDIKIKMLSEAIYSGHNFVALVKDGFYDKSYFMRVIGNFVAQGGDPVGDGEGTSGKNIREELSFLSHKIGTVGMASAGKDTGDSQFFINTSDNIHLDRNYTVFGYVVEGLDVAMKLAHGDQILEASVE